MMKTVWMTRGWWPRGKVVLIVWSLMVMAFAATELASAQVPGACNTPVSQRLSEVGCYLTASAVLGSLGPGPVFWHLYTYPTRAAAEAAKGPHGTVVESFGKAWLYTIAGEGWRPSSGERVAVLGPLAITSDKKYTARYMEAVFKPNMRTAIHRHSGPEAWYLISGAQCLETPDGITVARAGEGAVVPEGPPMSLKSVGTETRRSVLLVLHDASQPWVSMASDWQPRGRCPD
jgi:quercetin dioxygenase-like cupin family protein